MMRRRNWLGLLVAAGIATTAACGGGGSSKPIDAGVDAPVVTPLALVVTPTTLTVNEAATGTFTVALNRAPTSAVTVNVTTADRTVATVAPSTLTFSPTDFSTPQTVTVTGTHDSDTQDNTTSVTLSANGVDNVNVAVTVKDIDVQTIQIQPATLTVLEGTTGSLDVRLGFMPQADVTVTIATSDATAATVSPATLTFTSANFALSQRVTVTGVVDADTVDAHPTLTFTSAGVPDATVAVTVTDKDVQNLAVTPSAVSLNEGGTATFTVALTQRPAANISVNVVSGTTTSVSVAPASLTFTPANYNTPQTVTLTGVQDDNTIDENVTVAVSAATLTTRNVTVAVHDDDVQAIVVQPATLMVNEGATGTFTVRLAFNPSSSLTVNLVSANTAAATVTPTSLTFNATNFASPQTITVTGVQDNNLLNEMVTVNLTSPSPNVTAATETVTVIDDDRQGFIVAPTSVTTSETMSTTFSVRLAFVPIAATTVTVASGDTNVATVSPASLSYTLANYDQPQIVTVTGVHDANLVDDTTNVVLASTAVTAPLNVPVTVNDIDAQGFAVNPGSLTVMEGGAPGTFTARLGFAPAGTVTVDVASSAPTKASVSPAVITFDATNFATPQTITVQGVNDLDAVNDTANVTLTDRATVGAVPTRTVPVTIQDKDTQAHVLSKTSMNLLEHGTSDTFTVALAAQPLAPVTVSVTSTGPAHATVSPSTLTFTPANYAMAQTVTVSPVVDPDLVDDFPDIIVSSAVAPDAVVHVRVIETDLQDIVVNPASMTVTEDIGPGQIAVSLAWQPPTTVGVNLTSNNPAAVLDQTSLLFTTSNYSTPQIVNVTTPSDTDQIDPAPAIVSVDSPGLPSKTVNVTLKDDDHQAIVTSSPTVALQEDGTGTFTVRLAFQPTAATEVITVASSNPAKATVSALPLTFTTGAGGNWAMPQTVTVTGVHDADVNNEVVPITLTSNIAATPAVAVTANVTDVDIQNIVLDVASLALNENPNNPFTLPVHVHLLQDPVTDLTVDVASADPGAVTTDVATLTFTHLNYLTNQTVNVSSVTDDDVRDETVNVTLSTTRPGVASQVVNVTVADKDTQGIVVPPGVTVTENSTAPLPIRLAFRPTTDVTISATSADGTKATVTPASLTFTSANYNVPQNFVVAGTADANLNNEATSVTLAITLVAGHDAARGRAERNRADHRQRQRPPAHHRHHRAGRAVPGLGPGGRTVWPLLRPPGLPAALALRRRRDHHGLAEQQAELHRVPDLHGGKLRDRPAGGHLGQNGRGIRTTRASR